MTAYAMAHPNLFFWLVLLLGFGAGCLVSALITDTYKYLSFRHKSKLDVGVAHAELHARTLEAENEARRLRMQEEDREMWRNIQKLTMHHVVPPTPML